MDIKETKFGEYNGKTVYSYTLKNTNGMTVTCITLGCIITKLETPEQNGNIENVVLGFDTVEEYLEKSPYFGAVIGRVAGRIYPASFNLDGEIYYLPKNENANHLHGGHEGFDRKLWKATTIEKEEEIGIEFSYISSDGEEGYPGNLSVKTTYLLNNDNELIIEYSATTDKKTLVNLTNHTYFNLSGNCKTDIRSHKLTIKSEEFLELNEQLIPTGNILNVENTPFDYRGGKPVKEGISSDDNQVKIAGQGIDHPFVLSVNHDEEISLIDEASGRKLIIETDEPSVVVYTSNMLDESFDIRGIKSRKYLGVCLETQGLPNSINNPAFTPCILDAGEEYKTHTKYRFLTV